MTTAILTVINMLVWPVTQVSIAWLMSRIDVDRFSGRGGLFRLGRWENAFYDRRLKVKAWKRWLPDGAALLGSDFSKKRLVGSDPVYLRRFAAETRRGETAHWLMMGCFPIFCLWNPPWACVVMALYGVGANLPCIVVQRYNRGVILRLLSHRT
jgi:glycosyl-4,4'-diaponeurosporenoate acyltransferase